MCFPRPPLLLEEWSSADKDELASLCDFLLEGERERAGGLQLAPAVLVPGPDSGLPAGPGPSVEHPMARGRACSPPDSAPCALQLIARDGPAAPSFQPLLPDSPFLAPCRARQLAASPLRRAPLLEAAGRGPAAPLRDRRHRLLPARQPRAALHATRGAARARHARADRPAGARLRDPP